MPGHYRLLEWAHQDALKRGDEEKHQKIVKATRARAERAVVLGPRRGLSGRGSPSSLLAGETQEGGEPPWSGSPQRSVLGVPGLHSTTDLEVQLFCVRMFEA